MTEAQATGPVRRNPAMPPCACRPLTPAGAAWFAALLGWTLLIAFFQLGADVGLEPVEAWVAQPAREMYERAAFIDYVIPRFCDEVRMQKSPGAYWTVCLTTWLRGRTQVDELSVRIPNAVFAVLLVATIFWLTRRIAGDRPAVFAGFAAASSTMFLHWSHGGASDLGVTTLMSMSLAFLWIGSESEPPGARRVLFWLAGYLLAGLAMLYKMPLPLAVIGLTTFLYLLVARRWRLLASPWHLLGLLLFLAPWLPWVVATLQMEPTALDKWRVEYLDRLTGDLPNVDEQKQWFFYLMYVGVALLLSIPWALSVPQALVRAFRRDPEVEPRGQAFLLCWFLGMFAFFTYATGKETRYFLPAMPPLFALLGIELSHFFSPARPARRRLDNLGFLAVLVLTPAALYGVFRLLRKWFEATVTEGMFTWAEFWPAAAAGLGILGLGIVVSAALYRARREHASFGALVLTMWLTWMWVWPNLMPMLQSQAPFRDFAAQIRERLSPEQQAALRQIAHQDPRYIWYSGVRFPRIVDQLELLEMQGGRRDVEQEAMIILKELVHQLRTDPNSLFVISPDHYLAFRALGPEVLARNGAQMPEHHVWIIASQGRLDRRYLVIGASPPPWPEPALPAPFHAQIERMKADPRYDLAALAALYANP